MKEDRQKRIDEVLGSMKGSQRAQPPSDLFSKIDQKINQREATVVSLSSWRWVAAAAVILFLLNGTAMMRYARITKATASELLDEAATDQSLISNYKLYE